MWDSKEIIRIHKTLYEEQELRRLKINKLKSNIETFSIKEIEIVTVIIKTPGGEHEFIPINRKDKHLQNFILQDMRLSLEELI